MKNKVTTECSDNRINKATLLPCPFCGAKAKAKRQDPYLPEQPRHWWTIECSHGTRYHHKRGTGCPVMPMACADTLAEATNNWNMRHGNAQ